MQLSKKKDFYHNEVKKLFITLLFVLENVFYKNFFTFICIQNNEIEIIIFIDTFDARFEFLNKKFVKII